MPVTDLSNETSNETFDLLTPLEPRLVFDGAAANDALDGLVVDAIDLSDMGHVDAGFDFTDGLALVAERDIAADRREVIFVDASIANLTNILGQLPETAEIQLVDSSTDGIAAIANWASTQTNIDAIHIISHGAQGELYLGSSVLSSDTIAAVSAELTTLGGALTETGDILLYGCNIADGAAGLDFIERFAQATSADVAASSDDTGTAVLGGDWDLEVQAGDVDTHSLDLADYDGVLAGLEYADLSTWSASGDSRADWVLLSGNRTVFQTYNGSSMYYVSADSDIINQAVQLTLRQTDNVVIIDGIDYQTGFPNDDDQFGFVLGFQDASNHILLEWGGNDRGTAAGLTLYRVVNGSRAVITSLTGAGEEWVGDVLYDFKILYMSNQIKIMIDGVEVLNTGDLGANAFQAGGIGFYNQSQGGVEYGNVRYAPGSLAEVVPTPSNDTYAVTKNTTLTVDRFSGVLSNDYDGNLDAFNIVFDGQELTSGTSHSKTGSFGLFTLNSDGSFSYVPTTNAIGTDSFTYTLTDNDGTSSSATITFYVREPNQAPTDIAITNNAVMSGAANDTSIGTLSTTDPDASDAFDYAITSQSTTGLFKIVDGVLKVADGTLLTAGTHTVTVRTTDLGGATYSKVFVITAEQLDPFIALPSGEYTTASVNASNVTAPNTGFTVTARNIVGGVLSDPSAANVSSNGTPSGFGVLGEASGDTKELGYNEAASLSEELIVKFDEIVPTASVKFAWGSDADATYTLYRQGVLVGSNTITISSLGSGDITAALAVTAPDGNGFDEIRFTAPGVEDDYLINEISYDRLNDVNSAAPAAVDEAADASAQNIAAITGGFTVLDGNLNDTFTLTLVGSPTVTLNGASHTLPATANALIANGVLTFATDGARTATGQAYTWTYDPGVADLDYLSAGDVVEITFTVKANDGNADSNLRTIKITINGTNDAPVFGAVTGLTSTGGTSGSSSGDLVSVFEVTEGPASTPLALEAGQTVNIGLYTANARGTSQLSFLSTFYNNEAGMTASNISTRFDGTAPSYDLIVVFQPTSAMTDNEIASLTSFVNNGGRVFFIGEHNGYAPNENANISDAITRLGGAITVLGGSYGANDFDDGTVGLKNINNSPLMAGVTSFKTAAWAQLQIDANISQAVLVADNANSVDNRITIADQAVGKGRVTLIADQNWLDDGFRIAGNETFLRNLAINSVQNVAVVSGGGNPNDGFGAAAGFDETNAPLVEGGTIAVSDVDLTDQVTAAVTNVSAVFDDGTVVDLATAMPSVFTAGQGMFTVSPAAPAVLIDNTETTDDLTWTFDSGTETFDFLAQGEKITFTYTITVTDSQGATATQDVDITINGTNDAPVASDASASVTEDSATIISGTLTSTDVDNTVAERTYTLDSAVAGLTLNTDGTWSFDGGDDAYQYLKDGQTLDVVANFTVKDAANATDGGTLTITVTGVNDAPVLGGTTFSLTTVSEDDSTNAGQLVSAIVGAAITDADTGAVEGIAITGLTESAGNGVWQYQLSGSSTWVTVGAVDATSALLLGSNDKIRFLPDEAFGGTASFTFNAWDQTSGTAGSKVAIGSTGGTTAFSTASKTANITVTSIDDAPVLTASATGTEMLTGTARAIAPGLTITDVDNETLSGAKVAINNLKSGDKLAAGTLPTGITASYNESTGVLTLSGSASLADYQAALRAVTFDTTSTDTTDRTFDFSLGEALAFSGNGHYYEFVTASGISWTDAKAAAEARTFLGMQGYLVTVTSAEENAFVSSKLAGQGWMGASDAATEGDWRWVTGPEGSANGGAGTPFWSGNGSGTNVDGMYDNWYPNEPNDYGTGEYYAHFRTDNTWNDFPNEAGNIQGYVVEYGTSTSGSGASSLQSVVSTVTRAVLTNTAIEWGTARDGAEATGNALVDNLDGSSLIFKVTQVKKDGGTYGSVAENSTLSTDPTVVTGRYGTLKIGENGSYTYDPTDYLGDVQALNTGEKLTDSFILNVVDANGAVAERTLVMTIDGTNDAPVAIDATASVNEDAASISGTLTSNDVDNTNAERTYTLDADVAGLTLATDGSWTFDAGNDAYQYLQAGETLNVVANFTVEDDEGATDGGTLTITVTGVNDGPVIGSISGGASGGSSGTPISDVTGIDAGFENGSFGDWVVSKNGATDEGEIVSSAEFDVNFDPALEASSSTPQTTVVVNANGTKMLKLTPDGAEDFDEVATLLGISAADKTSIDTNFDNVITDTAYAYLDVSMTAGQTLTFGWQYVATDYTPYNDGNLMTFSKAATVDSSGAITSFEGTPSGQVYGLDATAAILAATVPGTGNVNDPNGDIANWITGSYGLTGWQSATVTAATDGVYRVGFVAFNMDDTALPPVLLIDADVGTTVVKETGVDVRVLEPSVDGPNGATLDTGAGFKETDAPQQQSGTIAVSDVDLLDNVTAKITNVSAVFYDDNEVDLATKMPSVFTAGQGMFTISPADPAILIDNTETTDDLTWTFDSGTETFDFLAQGEKITFTYTITVTDTQGATATQDVDITINGTNDAPVVEEVIPETVSVTGALISYPTAYAFSDIDASDVLVYSASGLPPGMTIDPATGIISGSSIVPDDYTVIITATDPFGGTVDAAPFILKVVSPPAPPAPLPPANDGPPAGPADIFTPEVTTDTVLKKTAPGKGLSKPAGEPNGGGMPAGGVGHGLISAATLSTGSIAIARPLPDMGVTSGPVGFIVPRDTFITTASSLSLSASLADGSALPDWLEFNAETGEFSGTPPEGYEGELDLMVKARDSNGGEASTSFTLTVGDLAEQDAKLEILDWDSIETDFASVETGKAVKGAAPLSQVLKATRIGVGAVSFDTVIAAE